MMVDIPPPGYRQSAVDNAEVDAASVSTKQLPCASTAVPGLIILPIMNGRRVGPGIAKVAHGSSNELMVAFHLSYII